LNFIARLFFEVKVVRREIFTCRWEICFSFHCCFQSLSSPLSALLLPSVSAPTGCFICHSCCLFIYQPRRFYQSCYFLLYLSVLLIPSLFFISLASSFSILYQSCYFLLYSLSVLLVPFLFFSPANPFSVLYQSCYFLLYLSVMLIPSLFFISLATSFSILYQSCYFVLYSLSVLLLPSLFFVGPATSFSILYQSC